MIQVTAWLQEHLGRNIFSDIAELSEPVRAFNLLMRPAIAHDVDFSKNHRLSEEEIGRAAGKACHDHPLQKEVKQK